MIEYRIALQGDGDFRSAECARILTNCDIVTTNPPFSLLKEYVPLMMEHGDKVLILGNQNIIAIKSIFPYIRDNRLWIGKSIHSGNREFEIPPDYEARIKFRVDADGKRYIPVSGIRWFTNLGCGGGDNDQFQPLTLTETYSLDKYPKYDNYDAIYVDKTKKIPILYKGIMGVPLTFLDKYDPSRFRILGITKGWDKSGIMTKVYKDIEGYQDYNAGGNIRIDGKLVCVYPHLLIQWIAE